jgi:hypothetical protein
LAFELGVAIFLKVNLIFMVEFYSIDINGRELKSLYQLPNLGDECASVTIGKRRNEFWGSNGTPPSKTYHRKVVPEDYDRNFVYMMIAIKPPYEIDNFINFHLNYYLSIQNSSKDKYIKHIKYVILPIVKEIKDKAVYVDLINEWVEKNDVINNHEKAPIMSIINTGDIHAPVQFQQGVSNSKQTQEINYKTEDIKELFLSIKKDIETLNTSIVNEFSTEIEYALKQIEKGKDIKPQLKNIGQLIKDVGINVFANLVASPIYESIKPLLGF